MLLFEPAGNTYQVSLPAVIAMAAAIAGLMGFAAIKIVQARRAPVVTGTSELVGQVGVVRDALAPAGTVFVRGELWKARSNDGPLARGAPVRVDSIDDELVLGVEPAEQPVPVT
jgi:membrane-bound serine protease (ClpP class)